MKRNGPSTPTRCRGGAFILALIGALLPACVSLEKECREAKWYDLGFEKGNRGFGEYFKDQYLKKCPPFGVTPDEEAMKEGWFDGNEGYCQPESIGEEARTGSVKSFPSVCDWARQEIWPLYVEGRCEYLRTQIPIDEELLANLRKKFEKAEGKKAKRAHISFLMVGLRTSLESEKADYGTLGCGR